MITLIMAYMFMVKRGAGNYPEGAGESATVNEFNER